MNVKRFSARTSRDALVLVRQALGDDAVVLSTKPSVDGVEVLAMAPEGMQQIERMAGEGSTFGPQSGSGLATSASSRGSTSASAGHSQPAPTPFSGPADTRDVDGDVAELSMSTLSFQDYVRERMLRRRHAAMAPEAAVPLRVDSHADSHLDTHLDPRVDLPVHSRGLSASHPARRPASAAPFAAARQSAPAASSAAAATAATASAHEYAGVLEQRMSEQAMPAPLRREAAAAGPAMQVPDLADLARPGRHAEPAAAGYGMASAAAPTTAMAMATAAANANATAATATARRDQDDMMSELRQVKGLIEERFGALAFMEKLQRQPAQARLTQKLLDCGLSPALIRKIGDSLPPDSLDETAWAASVLERNLLTADAEAPLEDQGGVYALVGATGVGKTTTTAKIAAAFAAKYGANNLGLITLDAYRIGAHEQLRAYGRILGVPVHTAHDRASLEDLLELLAGKKMVLIDTAGMAQRDARTRELLDMLSHASIQKLLVINAASQGETIEDVMIAYHAPLCAGIVLSKMDEAVKLGPAVDALIRHKLKVIGVANGQRVPEDWHRLSANALVHRALRAGGSNAYKLDASDVSLIFTALIGVPSGPQAAHTAHIAPASRGAALPAAALGRASAAAQALRA